MRFRSAAVALSAMALASVGSAAWASAPYNIQVGSSTSGDHDFTATSKTAVNFVVQHGTSTVPMGCNGVTGGGYVTAGANSTGEDIATIENTTWAGCVGPFMQSMHVDQVGDWSLNAYGTATNALTDSVDGWVGNITAHVYAGTSPSACDFYVSGIASGAFDENVKTGGLQDLIVDETGFTGNLYVSSVIGNCLGLIGLNDPADFSATINVASADGSVNIKP